MGNKNHLPLNHTEHKQQGQPGQSCCNRAHADCGACDPQADSEQQRHDLHQKALGEACKTDRGTL